MTRVRIKGLLGLADRVRRELAEGVSASRLAELKNTVEQGLRTVDECLAASGLRPDALPPPSRKAREFLAAVDFGRVAAGPAQAGPPPRTVSFVGLRAFVDEVLDRMAIAAADAERCDLAAAISRAGADIEASLRADGLASAHLKPESRALAAWLAYFARPENFAAYGAALATARRAFEDARPPASPFPLPLLIHFRPLKGLYRLAARPGGTRVMLPTPMITFDEPLLRALAALSWRRTADRQPILAAMMRGPYQAVLAQVEVCASPAEVGAGLRHDLRQAFERVNAAYFAGAMAAPRLEWSRAFTFRKFGHYDRLRDAVMVSLSLDGPDVPEYVIDFVMYHELLHRHLGAKWDGGRQAQHTPEFRQAEKRFHRYQEARAFLQGRAGRR
ncbi:MAG: M48 family metallopeptidase [Planctomycetes bacterium]|nr:M48 family metallopeptidase [Planctomycetota bacterium]